MKKLKQLVLKNFQRHKRLKIDIDPAITVIVGDSDTGKSAIIRALRLLCLNQPKGKAFISHGEKVSEVSVRIGKVRIRRIRSASRNEYMVGMETLKAFNSEVPGPVRDLLQVSGLNFQQQHDSPFWFTLSPGALSKEINRLVDLEIIDSALKRIGAKKRENALRTKIQKESYADLREQRKALEWTLHCTEDYNALNALWGQWEEVEDDRRELEKALSKYKEHVDAIKTIGQVSADIVPVCEAQEALAACSRDSNKLEQLIASYESIIEIDVEEIENLESCAGRLERSKRNRARLASLVDEHDRQDSSYTHAKEKVARLAKKLQGMNCPVCGRSLQ